MQNSSLCAIALHRKTKTNTIPNPDPNRYRRRCPDPNARIQKTEEQIKTENTNLRLRKYERYILNTARMPLALNVIGIRQVVSSYQSPKSLNTYIAMLGLENCIIAPVFDK